MSLIRSVTDLAVTGGAIIGSVLTDQQPNYSITLEVRNDLTRLISMDFPVMPSSLDVVKRYLTTVTTTDGGIGRPASNWVDDFGIAPFRVSMRGTFGYAPKFVNGAVIPVMTGHKATQYLTRIVDESHSDRRERNITARLYMWPLQQFWDVNIDSFGVSQRSTRGSNLMWQYTLDVTVLGSFIDGRLDVAVAVLKQLGRKVLADQITRTLTRFRRW